MRRAFCRPMDSGLDAAHRPGMTAEIVPLRRGLKDFRRRLPNGLLHLLAYILSNCLSLYAIRGVIALSNFRQKWQNMIGISMLIRG
ncbi:hypothetical protein EDE08_12721 [Bradyrhizobium sp. R2.2-H]|uniref:hypothetical protein n=1 Tax=unclassified Bradyrhizobium TaxID=2631580 RepID=UPI00105135C5|nr:MULTISPECIES: hypothetical protein [unclassified Bradyrhizobium]TCU60123.1 hypothetical protein EDE10_12726 [Bradyrhizobium sp. Y-H1]TCU63866.1 hypothetical protein EDE08_12721 [Bradyrhizobium sp. R2.2-H]